MSISFLRGRFGSPQIIAGLMLLIFLGECAWLVAQQHSGNFIFGEDDSSRVQEGLAQWRGRGIAATPANAALADQFGEGSDGRFSAEHSPLWYLIASAPLAVFNVSPDSWLWLWLTRAPYVLFGGLLGASVWYVARRLYGNAGGYTALALYCFSPTVIRASTMWFSPPNIGGAWGAFGAVFTAIAVSHTLYAPREVVLWNWRRILLLGISLALAVGSDFRLAIVLPLLVIFMLYAAPERKGAALVIFTAACAATLAILFAAYFFHPRLLWHGFGGARWLDISLPAIGMLGAYRQVADEIAASGPVLVILAPIAVVTFAFWRRCRYFGNSAPLVVAVLFGSLRVAAPHEPESALSLLMVVFLFVFVAGIAADVLETKRRELATAVITGLLVANAVSNLFWLARVGRS